MFPVLTQELSSSDQKRAESWRTLKCNVTAIGCRCWLGVVSTAVAIAIQ